MSQNVESDIAGEAGRGKAGSLRKIKDQQTSKAKRYEIRIALLVYTLTRGELIAAASRSRIEKNCAIDFSTPSRPGNSLKFELFAG
jgi:hypothetical protein